MSKFKAILLFGVLLGLLTPFHAYTPKRMREPLTIMGRFIGGQRNYLQVAGSDLQEWTVEMSKSEPYTFFKAFQERSTVVGCDRRFLLSARF